MYVRCVVRRDAGVHQRHEAESAVSPREIGKMLSGARLSQGEMRRDAGVHQRQRHEAGVCMHSAMRV